MSNPKIDLNKLEVTSDNYVDLVLRTESVEFPEIRGRMIRPDIWAETQVVMADIINLGHRVDRLKKAIFYNDPKHIAKFGTDSGVRLTMTTTLERALQEHIIRILHCIMGLMTENAEIVEHIQAYINEGVEIDWKKLSKELGDSEWYFGIGVDVQGEFTGKTMDDVLKDNIVKLAERYPEGFTEYHAVHRAENDV